MLPILGAMFGETSNEIDPISRLRLNYEEMFEV